MLAAPAGPAEPPSRRFVETVDVSMVLVPVVVRDASGRPVIDLAREEFSVAEEGVSVPLASFGREAGPVSIVLALDTSPSMQPYEMAAKRAALEFVRRQEPGTAFALEVFNDGVFLEADFTADRAALEIVLGAVRSTGENTALYDAVSAAAGHLKTREGGRVAVVFTDGADTVHPQDQEDETLSSAIEAAARRDVSVYTVAFGARAAASILRRMSDETGGEAFSAATARDLSAAFAHVAESVGSRYLLAYRPPEPQAKGFRRIEVKVARPGVRVAARRGYFAR